MARDEPGRWAHRRAVLLSLALWAGVVILLTALPARPDASPRLMLGRWVAIGYAAAGWLVPLLLLAADARARRRAAAAAAARPRAPAGERAP